MGGKRGFPERVLFQRRRSPLVIDSAPRRGDHFPEWLLKACIEENNPAWACFIAMSAGQVVGITAHYADLDGCPEMWLGYFGVLPSMRNKGFGRQILEATLEKVAAFHAPALHLYSGVHEYDLPAHKFYLSNGFVQYDTGEAFGEPVVYFRHELPQADSP